MKLKKYKSNASLIRLSRGSSPTSEQVLWGNKIKLELSILHFKCQSNHFLSLQAILVITCTPYLIANSFNVGKSKCFKPHTCCIFWPVFGCCVPQLLVEILIFSIKLKFFTTFYRRKGVFIRENLLNLGIWCNQKTPVFLLNFTPNL